MQYEKVILELLTRIQNLEKEVEELKRSQQPLTKKQMGTAQIREYIEYLKKEAIKNGENDITLKANDIHNALSLKSRMPAVCNAMKQSMKEGDEVIYETPSGFSSTYTIRYKF